MQLLVLNSLVQLGLVARDQCKVSGKHIGGGAGSKAKQTNVTMIEAARGCQSSNDAQRGVPHCV